MNIQRESLIFSLVIGGLILPDRCDAAEPIKEKFNKHDISAPVNWLSFPTGSLLVKKKHQFDVEIKNENFAIIFCEDGKSLVTNTPLPKYLGKITFWFSKQCKIDMVFLETLLRDFCTYLNANNGIIFDQETHEVLVDIFR